MLQAGAWGVRGWVRKVAGLVGADDGAEPCLLEAMVTCPFGEFAPLGS